MSSVLSINSLINRIIFSINTLFLVEEIFDDYITVTEISEKGGISHRIDLNWATSRDALTSFLQIRHGFTKKLIPDGERTKVTYHDKVSKNVFAYII